MFKRIIINNVGTLRNIHNINNRKIVDVEYEDITGTEEEKKIIENNKLNNNNDIENKLIKDILD